ncbi:MAG: efflux RND transporter permease subunit [Paracoccaceae bacterium]
MRKDDDEGDPVVRVALSSSTMSALELSDYADRYLVDRLARLPGVANTAVYGERAPAMRVWLDTGRMAAHGITPGYHRRPVRQQCRTARGRDRNPALPPVAAGAHAVFLGRGVRAILSCRPTACALRLGDVARIEKGAEEAPDTIFRSDGVTGLGMGIQPRAQANTVAISAPSMPSWTASARPLPRSMALTVTADEAVFIETTLQQVAYVFLEAVIGDISDLPLSRLRHGCR